LEDHINPEILLLSAIVQTKDIREPLASGLTPEHFHTQRRVWDWLESFYADYGKVPDKPTFRSRFPDFPLLRTTDLGEALEQVQDAHLRYQLSTTMRQATDSLVDNDPHEALAYLRTAATEMAGVSVGRDDYHDALRNIDPFVQEAQRRSEMARTMGYAGVTLGFPTLNDRTGGLHPGDLAIWAARLGQGKTWMLCKVAKEALMTGKRVCFVSLEQSRSQITFRMHTLLARELGYSLRHRDLMQGTNFDLDDYRSFLMELPKRVPEGAGFYVSDPTSGRANPFTLAALMERHQPDLMIVDYLTLMQAESDEWQGIAKLSKDTKQVAGQYGTPILAAAQINREGDGGRRPPGPKNLSQSDGIGQDADVIVTHRQQSPSTIDGLLAKNRSGQGEQLFHVAFQPNDGRIEQVSADEARTLAALDAQDQDDY